MRKWVSKLPMLCLLTTAGCLSNRAMFNPWPYAPPLPSEPWTPPKAIAPSAKLSPPSDIPQGELTLAQLIDIALQNNPQTTISWAEARAAAAAYAQNQSQEFPTITPGYTYARSLSPILFKNRPVPVRIHKVPTVFFSTWGPDVALTYTVLDFGQLQATTEAALQALYYANWTHNRMLQTVMQTISLDYYGYLYQRQLLTSYEADLRTDETTLEAAIAELQTGTKSRSDYLAAQSALLQKQTQLSAQKQSVKSALTTLLNDMGLPANATMHMRGFPETIRTHLNLQDLDELLDTALRKRADLLAARANLQQYEEKLSAAKRTIFPQVTYNFQINKSFFAEGARDKYDFSSVLSVSMPIFPFFSYLNAVRGAQANRDQAMAQVKQSKLQVYKDVTTARYDITIAQQTLESARAFLQASREQYDVALRQYKAGTTTILDVLTAQSNLADARAGEASALQQWFVSLATLAYATGALTYTMEAP